MHLAPAATLHVGDSPALRHCVWGLWCACATAGVALNYPYPHMPWALCIGAWMLAPALLAWYVVKNQSTGVLRWDGQAWHWSGASAGGNVRKVRILADWQTGMLVQIALSRGGCQWLWLHAGASVTRWRAMRRALVCAQHVGDMPDPQRGRA